MVPWVLFHRKTRSRVVVPEHEAASSSDARRIAAQKLGCMPDELDLELTRTIRADTPEEEREIAKTAAKGEIVWSFGRGK